MNHGVAARRIRGSQIMAGENPSGVQLRFRRDRAGRRGQSRCICATSDGKLNMLKTRNEVLNQVVRLGPGGL